MKIIKIFCEIQDSWKRFQAEWEKILLPDPSRKRGKAYRLCMRVVLTIVISFPFRATAPLKIISNSRQLPNIGIIFRIWCLTTGL
jgi:hypothetical protein